jgi:Mlc titration factor MtfA (ptsG expression regulator)
MEPLTALLIIAVPSAAVLVIRPWLRSRRREQLRKTPFPMEWERILNERLRLYRRIPERLKRELRKHILIFLAEKRFFGCGGLEITDAMRVLIAAQACLLILNRKTDYYRKLRSILVYPSAFIVNREIVDEAGVHTSWREPRIGESWEVGRVIISWDEVEPDEWDRERGENVVLHEFAHQLDEEDGIANGTPVLGAGVRYDVWAQVLGAEYRALREKVTRGEATLIDPYGAEDAGEFFASATECFFERPGPLCEQHPTLYATLRDYYRVDPAVWHHDGTNESGSRIETT